MGYRIRDPPVKRNVFRTKDVRIIPAFVKCTQPIPELPDQLGVYWIDRLSRYAGLGMLAVRKGLRSYPVQLSGFDIRSVFFGRYIGREQGYFFLCFFLFFFDPLSAKARGLIYVETQATTRYCLSF